MIVCLCSCGKKYTLEQFVALPTPASIKRAGGDAQYTPADDGDDEELRCQEHVALWRDCTCGSSHLLPLVVMS
jgi:hypothetical protein